MSKKKVFLPNGVSMQCFLTHEELGKEIGLMMNHAIFPPNGSIFVIQAKRINNDIRFGLSAFSTNYWDRPGGIKIT